MPASAKNSHAAPLSRDAKLAFVAAFMCDDSQYVSSAKALFYLPRMITQCPGKRFPVTSVLDLPEVICSSVLLSPRAVPIHVESGRKPTDDVSVRELCRSFAAIRPIQTNSRPASCSSASFGP